ncbi:MAG TPA: FG-GAP-like repeat-containing protein, partial [Ilumatobacteraceae bacterium]|nr:FG-GAP-like repeat-containing protein [Ilumatobacteraceae bacterium]
MFAPTAGGVRTRNDGTSFSAPVVAGVALLLAAQHPDWTGDQIAERLTATALDVGPVGRDPYHGAGLVDPIAALGGAPAPATGPPQADFNGTPQRATSLIPGVRVRDAISIQGDEDWFSIEIAQPTAFSVTLYPDAARIDGRAEAFDAVIDVFEPDLQRLARIDENGNETPESDLVSLPGTGRFYLRVTNANPSRSLGGYEIGLFSPGPADPQERFEPTVVHRIDDIAAEQGADQARSVALGDVTGDGRVDTVLTAEDWDTEENDDKLFVFAGNAAGTLDPPVVLPAPGTSQGLGLALADLDGDGAKDAAIAAGGVLLLSYQRAGRLTTPRPLAAGTHVQLLEAADLDGDGDNDLIGSGTGVTWYRNTPAGFERTPLADGLLRDAAVGDVNGDGRLDVVAAHDSYLLILRQAEDHTFAAEQVPGATSEVELGDVTGDGSNDIVSLNDRKVTVRAGGVGAPQVVDENSIRSVGLDLGDIDGDGRTDAAAVHDGGLWAETYLQQPGGGLGPGDGRQVPQGSTRANGLAIGDANADGAADISYANDNYGLVARRARSATFPLPAWVRGSTPDEGARGVAGDVVPELQLARAVALASVTSDTVWLERSGVRVGGTPSYAAGTLRFQPAALAAGDYALRVSGVRDTRGNRLEHTLRFTVGPGGDATAPDTVLRSAPSGTVKSQSPRMWAYATEPGATLQCSLDSAPFAPCPDPIAHSSIFPGTHSFRVRAVDGSGRVDPTPATRGWFGDEQFAAPANDTRDAMTVLAGSTGSVTTNTAAATRDDACGPVARDSPGAQSIWFQWTAPADGWATFDTTGSSIDTLLGVFAAGCREEHRLAESDDAPGRITSRVRVWVRSGTSYAIAVDGYSPEGVN